MKQIVTQITKDWQQDMLNEVEDNEGLNHFLSILCPKNHYLDSYEFQDLGLTKYIQIKLNYKPL